MRAGLIITWILLFVGSTQAQHLTGYYESDPPMENYDHFKIHHKKGQLVVRAFIKNGELWSTLAYEIDDVEADYFIKKYGQEKDVTSVHQLKVLLDGLDWEFFLLAYKDTNNKNRFIVVEEIFMDETKEELLELHQFEWSHIHHKG